MKAVPKLTARTTPIFGVSANGGGVVGSAVVATMLAGVIGICDGVTTSEVMGDPVIIDGGSVCMVLVNGIGVCVAFPVVVVWGINVLDNAELASEDEDMWDDGTFGPEPEDAIDDDDVVVVNMRELVSGILGIISLLFLISGLTVNCKDWLSVVAVASRLNDDEIVWEGLDDKLFVDIVVLLSGLELNVASLDDCSPVLSWAAAPAS